MVEDILWGRPLVLSHLRYFLKLPDEEQFDLAGRAAGV
jgi:hypothetical protein